MAPSAYQPQRQLRFAFTLAVAGLLLAGARCQSEAAASTRDEVLAFHSRHLLQLTASSSNPPSPQECILKNCLKEAATCQGDSQCALGLSCAANCTSKINPKKPESWLACQIKCLYAYSLYNANSTAFNLCTLKSNCTVLPPTGNPRICLPPKGGAAKVKAEELRGRYNVLAGATKLMDCQTAQFRFGYPTAGQYVYKEYPSYLKPKLITLPPYNFTGHKGDFTFVQGVVAGLPDINEYVVLDATKGNKFVLLMYCNQGTNVIGGYVLGKASSIPKSVRRRFAKKLKDSVWAAYYDLPLSAFCKIKARKFP